MLADGCRCGDRIGAQAVFLSGMKRVALVIGWGCAASLAHGDSAGLLTKESAPEIREMIRPQDDESLFRTISWHTDFWEARKIAAAEGKPIFIWAGSGGGPVGVC